MSLRSRAAVRPPLSPPGSSPIHPPGSCIIHDCSASAEARRILLSPSCPILTVLWRSGGSTPPGALLHAEVISQQREHHFNLGGGLNPDDGVDAPPYLDIIPRSSQIPAAFCILARCCLLSFSSPQRQLTRPSPHLNLEIML